MKHTICPIEYCEAWIGIWHTECLVQESINCENIVMRWKRKEMRDSQMEVVLLLAEIAKLRCRRSEKNSLYGWRRWGNRPKIPRTSAIKLRKKWMRGWYWQCFAKSWPKKSWSWRSSSPNWCVLTKGSSIKKMMTRMKNSMRTVLEFSSLYCTNTNSIRHCVSSSIHKEMIIGLQHIC